RAVVLEARGRVRGGRRSCQRLAAVGAVRRELGNQRSMETGCPRRPGVGSGSTVRGGHRRRHTSGTRTSKLRTHGRGGWRNDAQGRRRRLAGIARAVCEGSFGGQRSSSLRNQLVTREPTK